MKKRPRKQTHRERALSCAVREVLRVFDDDHRCHDCWAEDEKHLDDCITTTLRRASCAVSVFGRGVSVTPLSWHKLRAVVDSEAVTTTRHIGACPVCAQRDGRRPRGSLKGRSATVRSSP